MNYALWKLYKEKKYNNYEAFFLITNDTTFENYNIIQKLYNVLKSKKKKLLYYHHVQKTGRV